MGITAKTVVFWLVIVVSAIALWQSVRRSGPQSPQPPEISYSQFLSQVAGGDVRRVVITGHTVEGLSSKTDRFRVIIPANQSSTIDALQRQGVEIWFRDSPSETGPYSLLTTWAPLILLGALWFFMVRRINSKNRSGIPAQTASGTTSSPMPGSRFGP